MGWSWPENWGHCILIPSLYTAGRSVPWATVLTPHPRPCSALSPCVLCAVGNLIYLECLGWGWRWALLAGRDFQLISQIKSIRSKLHLLRPQKGNPNSRGQTGGFSLPSRLALLQPVSSGSHRPSSCGNCRGLGPLGITGTGLTQKLRQRAGSASGGGRDSQNKLLLFSGWCWWSWVDGGSMIISIIH